MISAKQAQSKTKEAIQRIKEEEKAEYSVMLSRIQDLINNSANMGEDKAIISDSSNGILYSYLYDKDKYNKVEKDLEGLGYSVVRDESSFPYITITINWGKNND